MGYLFTFLIVSFEAQKFSILMKVKVAQFCPTLCSVWLYSPWNSPGQNTRMGSLSLLQGIFPTQGLNPGLLHCRQILYQVSCKGSPRILEWIAYPFSSADPGIKPGSPALQADSLPTELSFMYLGSQVALVVKNVSANKGDIRHKGSNPGSGDPLEEGMATHSSILAWRIPWTEEPGRLQSRGSQRVRHNWSDLVCTHTICVVCNKSLVNPTSQKWCLRRPYK